MDQQQEQQEPYTQETTRPDPSYWPSVGIASLIFGIISFAIYLISTYVTINSEPSGSIFGPSMWIGILSCLVGAFAGLTAVWHYANEHDIAVTLGRGALIGFLAGAGMTVISAVLSQAWNVVDPDLTQKLIDSTVANMEAMEMPEANRQEMIDQTVESMRSSTTLGGQLLWGIPISGLLNLLTGMIGAKVFGREEE